MIKVFTAGGRDASRFGGSWAGLIALLVFCLQLQGYVQAQAPKPQPPATKPDAPSQPTPPGGGGEEPKADEDDDAAKQPPVDPSETQKGASLEVFLDPNAVAQLDLKKFKELKSPRGTTPADVTQAKQDAGQLKVMAGDPLVPVDPRVITAVIDDVVAKLTNHKNIEANLDPEGAKPKPEDAKAIQDATQSLLEPIFLARSAKNVQFQTQFNRILAQRLEPVLKNHLIPRIQAMIILAQSGNVDAYKIFLAEIKNPTQTVWVKLWAFRGLTNIKQLTNKLSTSQEMDAAKAVSDQLVKNQEWPWPVQFRGLEALATLRQGFLTTSPKTADMAATTFQYLINGELRKEVRAEAALALGLMQITTVVPKYNVATAAHAAAQLAAEIGDQIAKGFTENKLYAQKLTTMLMGPVLQAFEGRAGLRESGFLNSPLLTNKADVQKYIDAIRPVTKAAIDLVGGPAGQAKARNDELTARVAALKDFLAKNPPASAELFQGGPQLPAPAAAVAGDDQNKAEQKGQPKEKGDPVQADASKGRGKQ
ncbi:hypothetical protein [Paludisphaera borealis]|uniref:Uncharacterized protein n=1 Tax=Paludisphaera borealis TaxID=1387353 RepID=A0A1U7CN06_9BACT|nr:hypothetical protein [Paludisphaera borealis]APW60301.1 hypothetical protein BSF38_01769 [Paludisphaera borealis]